MYYATKIRMCTGCHGSNRCVDIDSIYLEGGDSNQFYKKAALYDYLKEEHGEIKVKLGLMPSLRPALSNLSEKYVRSEPNDTANDNLLKLPRE